jgi:uncharacterized alpha-E superfamily protein
VRLLARNAEALFWLARYLERGASLARVIEMQSSFGGQEEAAGWAWLLTLYNDEARFKEHHELTSADIIAFYVTEQKNPGSIRSAIHWARENARALRPFLPLEMWVQLNAFHGRIEKLGPDDIVRGELPRTCAEIRQGCLAQIGIAEGTLFRDEAYLFFKLGLLVERADQTSRLLDVKSAQVATAAQSTDRAGEFVFWSTILRTAAAYQVFNRLEHEGADARRVARLLILNPSHPRAIGFCVREITEALQVLRSAFRLNRANACLESCEVLMEGLQAAAADTRLQTRLHDFNDWVQRALMNLTSEISAAFFEVKPREAAKPADTGGKSQKQSQKQSQAKGQGQKQGQS